MVNTFFTDLHELALAAGVERAWRDVDGRDQLVGDEALAAILLALGHDAGSSRGIKSSLGDLAQRPHLPPMLVTEVGLGTPIATRASKAEICGEDGVMRDVAIIDGLLEPVNEPGYYDFSVGGQTLKLAVAPGQCPLPLVHGQKMWGTSVQIPALRGATSRAFGGFGELAEAAKLLGGMGCDALAINPVHALFPGVGDDYSPYSPSSRTFLNTAMADPALLGLPPLPSAEAGDLIDWPKALPQRLAELRQCFSSLDDAQRAMIAMANQAANSIDRAALQRHAVFDALDCYFRPIGAKDWRAWPVAFHDPDGAEVSRFAKDHEDEVSFHLFTQWLAREGLDAAQYAATEAGMAIGLITDLAVGVHTGGSDSWAMPEAMLKGLTIGAPPDPLGPHGQNWSITGFSPDGLRNSGYQPWIAMLRSALRSAGGLRIDHAFGLARLWVIPEGGSSSQGAYLTYPFLDLVRLLTLEAHRANALIIAEDLGTSPFGFTQAVSDRNILGMRVLWFERAADHGFIGAQDYPRNCVAMTGTHDTPTVAGWWTGRDLDWAARLGRLPEDVNRAKAEEIRDWDRGLLWSTFGDGAQRPAHDEPESVVDASLGHIASSPAVLALAPIEDLLGEVEQPNLPGTIGEHPNWCRRLQEPMQVMLIHPVLKKHLRTISERGGWADPKLPHCS
jgi:4-alpha-glucanotransferase